MNECRLPSEIDLTQKWSANVVPLRVGFKAISAALAIFDITKSKISRLALIALNSH
jgi:hypothetical protein